LQGQKEKVFLKSWEKNKKMWENESPGRNAKGNEERVKKGQRGKGGKTERLGLLGGKTTKKKWLERWGRPSKDLGGKIGAGKKQRQKKLGSPGEKKVPGVKKKVGVGAGRVYVFRGNLGKKKKKKREKGVKKGGGGWKNEKKKARKQKKVKSERKKGGNGGGLVGSSKKKGGGQKQKEIGGDQGNTGGEEFQKK